jgi:NAD(P)-dependent dehydrogenase (short-subunit alcohol dehydrogenase family)
MAGAALVSGGSRGLGLVLVERLLASGRAVATFSRTGSETLDQLKTRYGSRLQTAEVDAADSQAVKQFVEIAADHCDGIDVCVVNAGHAVPGMLATASDEAIEAVLAVNLRGAIVLVREVVRQMLAHPREAAAEAEASRTAHRDRSIVVSRAVPAAWPVNSGRGAFASTRSRRASSPATCRPASATKRAGGSSAARRWAASRRSPTSPARSNFSSVRRPR